MKPRDTSLFHLFKSAGLQKLAAATQTLYGVLAVAVVLLRQHILRAAYGRFFKCTTKNDPD